MKLTKSKLKEMIREELLKEDQYGADSGKFVPTKIDNYAPNTRE